MKKPRLRGFVFNLDLSHFGLIHIVCRNVIFHFYFPSKSNLITCKSASQIIVVPLTLCSFISSCRSTLVYGMVIPWLLLGLACRPSSHLTRLAGDAIYGQT